MAKLSLAFGLAVAAASFLASASAQNPWHCDNVNAEVKQGNPLGTCACEGHLWIAPGCQEGFFCHDASGEGCYLKCAEGELLSTSFANNNWECVVPGPATLSPGSETEESPEDRMIVCPAGGYNVCPGGESPEAPNPEDVTENPLGTCRCNGEVWVSEGCTHAFYCDDTLDIGGQYFSCPGTEVIYVDFEADDVLSTFECRTDQSTCPGGAILGAGCSIPACSHFSSNPYGKCECEGQLFINSECHEGFYCTENNPDPYLYDGCVQRCYQNQVLQPDFATKSWKCVNADQQPYCAGDFNLECTDHEPADGFNQDMCECEGQILISADCARGFYCRSRFVNGGVTIECPEGETIHANFDEWSYRCEADEISHCPGLGGFKAGCRGGNLEIPPLECDFQKNNLGECGCEGQIFVNNDCTETHLCTRIIPGGSPEGADGCHLSCPDGQKAYIDLHSKVWECREETPDYVCTGKFQTDCESDGSLNVMCGCENELWVNSDCDNAFFCTAANPGDQRNEGFFVSCPAGQVIDLGVWNPDGYQCTEETDRCPGQSYHFGCEGGDLGGIFTQAPTTNPGNGSTSWSGSLLMVVLSAFFVAFCRA